MISFCSPINASHYPSNMSLPKPLRSAFPGFGTLTRTVMMVDKTKVKTKTFSLEKRPREFNFENIEKAFDCEFVEVPDEITSAKDFRKWIMEMKFE